jgi:hypothetical protein
MGVIAGPVLKEDEEEIEVVPLSEVREALLGAGAERLAQRAYERAIIELPVVTPRWEDADKRVRAGFIAQARSVLDHFVLPAAFPSDSEEGQ